MQRDLLFQQAKQTHLSLIFANLILPESPGQHLDLSLHIFHANQNLRPLLAMLFLLFKKHLPQFNATLASFLQLLALLHFNRRQHARSSSFEKGLRLFVKRLSPRGKSRQQHHHPKDDPDAGLGLIH